MKEAANDNEPLSFITLAAATANVVRYLRLDEQETEHGKGKADADRTDEQKRKAHGDYVAERVRDIEAFERRASGGKN